VVTVVVLVLMVASVRGQESRFRVEVPVSRETLPPPRTVTPPDAYAFSIDGDFELGGFLFKEGAPFLHNDGGSIKGNTALGENALISQTQAEGQPVAERNTAVGASAMQSTTTGFSNTAVGFSALRNNSAGYSNVAVGRGALSGNTYGVSNTAVGAYSLGIGSSGHFNSALGAAALINNDLGDVNVAVGHSALFSNSTGSNNTALGAGALLELEAGRENTAVGYLALSNTTGDENIALGSGAGEELDTGNHNIMIGSTGRSGDTNRIRIGVPFDDQDTVDPADDTGQNEIFVEGIFGIPSSHGIAVYVNEDGKLGTTTSSRRFKEQIESLGGRSRRLQQLEAVSFRYKPAHVGGEAERPLQFGLIAEQVAEVFPELVVFDDAGEPYTVRYHLLSTLLLNELQRTNTELAELRERVDELRAESDRAAEQ
jgi:hypothetical protein